MQLTECKSKICPFFLQVGVLLISVGLVFGLASSAYAQPTDQQLRQIGGELDRLGCVAPAGAADWRTATEFTLFRYIVNTIPDVDWRNQFNQEVLMAAAYIEPGIWVHTLRQQPDMSACRMQACDNSNPANNEIMFSRTAAVDEYCWATGAWEREGTDRFMIMRGFVGGQVYIVRIGSCLTDQYQSAFDGWMERFAAEGLDCEMERKRIEHAR